MLALFPASEFGTSHEGDSELGLALFHLCLRSQLAKGNVSLKDFEQKHDLRLVVQPLKWFEMSWKEKMSKILKKNEEKERQTGSELWWDGPVPWNLLTFQLVVTQLFANAAAEVKNIV